MGEGRTPMGVGAGAATEAEGPAGDASPSAGARDSAILRLRKAIVWVSVYWWWGRSRNCGRPIR